MDIVSGNDMIGTGRRGSMGSATHCIGASQYDLNGREVILDLTDNFLYTGYP